MSKELTPEEEIAQYELWCKRDYARWHDLYINGGSDPTWEDGVNLNLVRNRILGYKRHIKQICSEIGYFLPAVCLNDDPPRVDSKYMAKKDEIVETAKKSLNLLSNDPEYQELLGLKDVLTEEQKKAVSYNAVISYVSNLEYAIKNNNFVAMRRYRYYKRYQEAFGDCLRRIKNPIKNPLIQI